MKQLLATLVFSSILLLAYRADAQTFDIQGQSTEPAPHPSKPKSAEKQGKQGKKKAPAPSEGIGWGSSIELGRLSRAAEQALAHGDASQAADYAARAVQSAPQNNRLWFLLGYTARLAGRYQQSIEAYQHGLRSDPNSLEGLSGLAQTYMRVGKSEEAKKLLLQVIASNPRRPVDLAIAGELFVQSGDTQRGADLLQRSEAMQPSTHTEVLLATAYMKLKQPDKAKELLNRARAHPGKNTDVFRAVANYYRESHDYKSAIATLQQIPRKTPSVLAELGYTYTMAGDRERAAATYAKAAAEAPKDLNIQLWAAASEVRLANYDGARRYLAIAQALDPNSYRLHAIRGDLARTEQRPADAIQEYQLALANLPASGAAEGVLYPIQLRYALAREYQDAGDEEKAQQQVKQASDEISRLDVQGPQRAEFLGLRAAIKAAGDDFTGAEKDLQEALTVDPGNINIEVQYAAMLWRMKRPADAQHWYEAALAKDPNNRLVLESLGYLFRDVGDNRAAEQFFKKLQAAAPDDFVPYMALGDLYTAERRLDEAQSAYEQAYKLAPMSPQVVAGGANAAIEAHKFDLAGAWLERAHGAMKDNPRVLREEERYLFHKGRFLESAQLGAKVLQKLPNDREGAVYLAYDLYNLGRYDDALAVARKYQQVLPREPNFPLLAGHAEKQSQLLAEAVDDYTRAIQIDPSIDQAWINRGYVLNDLQNAEQAAQDFQQVLKMEPNNGIAHLGLAFSDLQLHRGKLALEEAGRAQKLLGESGSTHLARAGAFRQMRLLADAEKEYRAALKFTPDDLTLHLALADTLYHLRHFPESITELQEALALSPDDAFIYGKMAHAYARLHQRDLTLRYVDAAEHQEPDSSAVLLDTGDALLTLGDERAAMERFNRALEAPDANRVDARLLIAKLMARQGRWDDARQQISLAFAESRIGEASPVTTDNLAEAANIFLSMHDFDLARKYFLKAKDAGMADQVVAIGLANTYIAENDPLQAQAQLAALGDARQWSDDYDYTLAMANIYRERRDSVNALDMFARANMLSGQDDLTERALQQAAGEEGLPVNQKLSVATGLSVAPVFDDSTLYTTYSRLNTGNGPVLPHSLIETRWTDYFRVHEGNLPLISGFFQLRNARGDFGIPSVFRALPVDTYDSIFNGAINPVLHLGRNFLAFNTGLEFTIRRDSISPIAMNQNLFRQFVYMQSSSFGNWVSVRATAMHEAGPFTDMSLSSRDLVGSVEFQVGRPWGNTALLTGYNVRDLLFSPQTQEWFQTATYAGIQRKFLRQRFTTALLGEFVRAWAVFNNSFGSAEMLQPAFQVDYRPNWRWEVNGQFAYSRGQGNHVYDNTQSGFFISYVKPLRRAVNEGSGEVHVDYPLRFSIGVQAQDFYYYTGRGQVQWGPVFRLTLF